MARSKKSSPKISFGKRFRPSRKTISFASSNGDISSNSHSTSASSAGTTKLSPHLSEISSINCSDEKNLSNKNVSKDESAQNNSIELDPNVIIKESKKEFCSKSVHPHTSSHQISSASGDNYSPSGSKFDSSVWSVRRSNVLKRIDNKKSPNKSSLSNRNRRKTLAFGDKSENLTDLTPSDVLGSIELPPTQPSGPLKDVIAFVEVYSGAENRTRYIANEIRNLGATVSQRFSNKVTHVIFREGLQSTIEKARARNIPCVSALWIDSCSKRNEKVPEDEFKICDVSESGVPIIVGRLRKPKSMQPERFDRDVVLSDERVKRRIKRAETYRLMKEIKNFNVNDGCDDKTFEKASHPVLVEDTPISNDLLHQIENAADRSSMNADPGWRAFTETFTPDSLRMQMSQLQRKIACLLGSPSSADSSFEEDSLAENVKKRLFGPGGILQGTPPPSFLSKKKSSRFVVPCSLECPISGKDAFKVKQMEISPVSTRTHFIVCDSVNNSGDSHCDRTGQVEEMIPETDTVNLMSSSPCTNDECEINVAVAEDQKEKCSDEHVARLDHSYPSKSNRNIPSVAVPRKIFSSPTKDPATTKHFSNVSQVSSMESSLVSVGPIVIVRRKSVEGKVVSTAVNTSMEKIPDVIAAASKDQPVHSIVIVRRRSLEGESNSTSVSESKKLKETSSNSSVDVDRSSASNKSNQIEELYSTISDAIDLPTKNGNSVENVINDVCRKVFSTESDNVSANKSRTAASNVGEKKKHLFNADEQVFRFWSSANQSNRSSSPSALHLFNEPTSIMEKMSTNTFNKNDIVDVFEPRPKIVGSVTKTYEKTKRLRSSLFFVKTSSALANELQFGRPSPEEFRSKKGDNVDATAKKVTKIRRRTIAASSNNGKTLSKIGKKSNSSRSNANRASLVLTSVVGSDRDVVFAAVKKLGKFSVEEKIGDKTTHVVCGDVRRTLTVLYGIVRGCFILSLDWVFRSIENGKWLKHDEFLIKQFQISTIERKKCKCRLLSDLGPIYVSPECKPPTDDIKGLIKLCGGKLASNSKRSQMCIGKMKDRENVDAFVVAEIWLLDSITKQKLLPFDTYLL